MELLILRALCIEMLKQGAFDWRPAMQALFENGHEEAAREMAMWLVEASIEPPDPRDRLKLIEGGKPEHS